MLAYQKISHLQRPNSQGVASQHVAYQHKTITIDALHMTLPWQHNSRYLVITPRIHIHIFLNACVYMHIRTYVYIYIYICMYVCVNYKYMFLVIDIE